MDNRRHLRYLRLGVVLPSMTATGPTGRTKARQVSKTGHAGHAARVRGRLAGTGEDATGAGRQRSVEFLEQLEPVFFLSSVDCRRPQIGDAPSKVGCPLPAVFGFALGFDRLAISIRC